MSSNSHREVRLEFTGVFEMVDLVQLVGDHLAREVGLDDDSVHWVGVAVRESGINAIKHGNKHDVAKHVFVEFAIEAPELRIRVRDQGQGFDPGAVADPLAPENILKS